MTLDPIEINLYRDSLEKDTYSLVNCLISHIPPLKPTVWWSQFSQSKKLEINDSIPELYFFEDETCCTVHINGSDHEHRLRVFSKTANALSFLFGSHYDAYSMYCNDGITELVVLNPLVLSRRREETPIRPISSTITANLFKRYLLKCHERFANDYGSKLRRFHGYLVDTYNLNLYSREMATAIAVAGFAEYIIEHFPDEGIESRINKQSEYETFVKSVKRKIDEIDGTSIFKNRVKQEIHGEFETARERVARAAEILGIDLNKQELVLWSKMRNKAAHPDFKEIPQEEREQRLFASINIFNTLLRGYIGWTEQDDNNQTLAKVPQ